MSDLAQQVHTTLDKILSSNKRVNQWVHGEEGGVYLRVTSRCSPNQDMCPVIDVASIEIAEEFQHQGVFKSVLSTVEQLAKQHGRSVFVESVLSEHLLNALPKYGYQQMPYAEPPAFWKNSAMIASPQKSIKNA